MSWLVAGDDQRVDLQHVHVLGHEGRVELAEQLGALLGEIALQLQRLGQRAAVVREDAGGRVDLDGDDLLGGGVGHVLDVHAALGGGDHGDPRGLAIHQQRQVQFAGDVGALLDVEAIHLAAVRPCLVGDEHAAEHLLGVLPHLLDRLHHAYAALGVGAEPLEPALAAASSVDLRLHHEYRAAELAGRVLGLLRGEGGIALRHGRAEVLQDGLGLVFVDVHGACDRSTGMAGSL